MQESPALFFMTTLLFLTSGRGESHEVSSWTHHIVFNSAFEFYWTPKKENIVMEIQVQTHGWISLGFSNSGAMTGADIIMGWITDRVHIYDCFALGNTVPIKDDSQDIQLMAGYKNETHTVLRFSRLWKTCDTQNDMELNSNTVRILWAYSSFLPQGSKLPQEPHQSRGVRSLYLTEPPYKPIEEYNGIKVWDLLNNNSRLPDDDSTHYSCQIFKAPHLETKHHMIGFKPIFQKGHESLVHHMVLYECQVSTDSLSSSTWFESHLYKEGVPCYSPNMPPEWSFCLSSNAWAWALGSEGETLPDHVGMPLGEKFGGANYFMLETHYDNPNQRPGLIDNSGLRIYYTAKLRPIDTAMLVLGSEVNFLHLIPPKQSSFTTLGRCMSECTESGLHPNGITVLSGILHSHLASRKMKLRHFRRGQELRPLLEDNNYDFNYQASRRPNNSSKIFPGDELHLECEYNTLSRSEPTFGGLSTREEMCIAYVLYYPKNPLADCRSLPSLQTTMSALGIDSIYGTAFEELVAFMKDIGSGNDETFQNLLQTLVAETQAESLFKPPKEEISSIEELLSKPFYVVESSSPLNSRNYRTLLSDLFLHLRIQAPLSFHNWTLAQVFSFTNWTNPNVGRFVEKTLYFGDHSSLCLSQGKRPLTSYNTRPFPNLKDLPKVFTSCDKGKKDFKSSARKKVLLNDASSIQSSLLLLLLISFNHVYSYLK